MTKVFALFGTIALDGVDYINKQLSGLDKTLRDTSRSLAKTGKDIEKLGVFFSKNFTAPIVAATGALTLLAKNTGEYADRILDLQQITGLSTDSIQKWKYAVEQAGGNFDSFISIVSRFTNKLPEVIKGGTGSSRAFSQLGISLKDASGNVRSMDDLFPDMIQALRGIENLTMRNAIAQDLFGKSLEELAPVLGMTQEELDAMFKKAQNTGAVLSTDALNAADEFRQSMVAMQSRIASTGRELAVAFIPLFRDVLFPLIDTKIVPAVRGLVDLTKSLADKFNSLSPEIKNAIVQFTAIVAVTGPLLIIVGNMIKQVAGLRATVLLFNSALISNPFVIAAAAIGAFALAISGAVNQYRDLRKEHSLFTMDQVKIKEFVAQYDAMIAKMKESGDALNSEGAATKILGKDIDALTEKARSLGYVIEGTTEERIKALNAIAMEVQGVRDATGALVKYEGAYKQVATTKKALIEEELEALRKLDEERNKFRAEDMAAEEAAETWKIDQDKKEYDRLQENWKKGEEIDEQILQTKKELADEEDRINQENYDKEVRRRQSLANLAIDSISQMFSAFTDIQNSKIQMLDEEESKERERIENSKMSATEKAKAIDELEDRTAKKKREVLRRQAVIEKTAALFSIGVSTAAAIMKAYKDYGFIGGTIIAILIGALAAVQIAAVAAKPLPAAAKGLTVKGNRGGTPVIVGEADQDEIILPLKTGVSQLTNGIIDRLSKLSIPNFSLSPAVTGATSGNGVSINLTINGLYGGDRGLKELWRSLEGVRVSEDGRIIRG